MLFKNLLFAFFVLSTSLSPCAYADDIEKQIGPWLDLTGGGISTGPAQGKTIKHADGTTEDLVGGLINASPIPAKGPSFERVVSQDEAYASGLMTSLLENAAVEYSKSIWPGWTMAIGEIAHKNGGVFEPHKSHQNGLDADIPFLGNHDYDSVLDKNRQVTSEFLPERNFEFWRLLYRQQILDNGKPTSVVSMILISPEIKTFLCDWAKNNNMLKDPENVAILNKIHPTVDHDDHFHLRLRCSPHYALCLKENIGPAPCP